MKRNQLIIPSLCLSLLLSLSFSFAKTGEPQSQQAPPVGTMFQGQLSGANYFLLQEGIVFRPFATQGEQMALRWERSNADISIYTVDAEGQYTAVEANSLGVSRHVEKVVYENIYFNIDLVVYPPAKGLIDNGLRYEFVVYPGGNPQDISLGYEGIQNTEVLGDGSLQVKSATASLVLTAPYAWQESGQVGPIAIPAQNTVTQQGLGVQTGRYEQGQVLSLMYDQQLKTTPTATRGGHTQTAKSPEVH